MSNLLTLEKIIHAYTFQGTVAQDLQRYILACLKPELKVFATVLIFATDD